MWIGHEVHHGLYRSLLDFAYGILRELLLTMLVTIFMTLLRREYKRRVDAGCETLHNILKYSIILFI